MSAVCTLIPLQMWLSTLAVYDIFPWVPCCRLCFLYPKGNGSMDCRTLLILNIFTCCQGPQGTSRPCCDDHHSHRSRGFHNGPTPQFGPGTGPGWPTRGDPKLGPRELLVCSALTWSYMAFVFQFYFWLIFCYFYHHHSVKLLSMFPKLYLTLCWVPVFLQLLQQFGFFFFFWHSGQRHEHDLSPAGISVSENYPISLQYSAHRHFGFPAYCLETSLPGVYLVCRPPPAPIIAFHNLLYPK